MGGLDLRLFSTIMTLCRPQDITLQELRIETWFPADQSSERCRLRHFADLRHNRDVRLSSAGDRSKRFGLRKYRILRVTMSVSKSGINPGFRDTTPGIESLPCSFDLPRHRHLRAYATLVLKGSFGQSGYAGRIEASVGDLLIHPTLDCHQNRMISAGVMLIRFNWPNDTSFGGLYHLGDIDEVARAAEKDMVEATFLLQSALRSCKRSPRQKNDWPDLLLMQLANDVSIELGTWADLNGLARETVSRGFSAAYGISPSVLRAELRAREAWLHIKMGTDSLASIAAQTGFADQAHMTRWIQRVTGAPPAVWRRRWCAQGDADDNTAHS